MKVEYFISRESCDAVILHQELTWKKAEVVADLY